VQWLRDLCSVRRLNKGKQRKEYFFPNLHRGSYLVKRDPKKRLRKKRHSLRGWQMAARLAG
jgi:hypothetical protein